MMPRSPSDCIGRRKIDIARVSTQDISVNDISIGTERLGEGNEARNVSTIAITVSRQQG